MEEQAPQRRFRIRLWMVAVVAGMLITGACVGAVAYGVLQGLEESDKAKAELTTFLRRISDGEAQAAYEQFSVEAKREVRFEDFARAREQRQFSDFDKLKTVSWNINIQTGADTTLLYTGVITYKQGDEGQVEAELVKQSGTWKIHTVTINR